LSGGIAKQGEQSRAQPFHICLEIGQQKDKPNILLIVAIATSNEKRGKAIIQALLKNFP
jgi:hypothetical protein